MKLSTKPVPLVLLAALSACLLISNAVLAEDLAQNTASETASSKASIETTMSDDESVEGGVPADLAAMNTATVAATLKELKQDPARTFAEHSGWVIAEKRIVGGSELWSFTPQGHDAYPAAIQRLITDGEEGLAIEMNIQCDASTAACESLDTLFSVMNENLIAVSKDAPPIR